MKILIVGGGIGGLTAARSLAREGHQVELVERAEAFSPLGAGIVFAPNASRPLEALGVRLPEYGRRLAGMDLVDASGRTLQVLDLEPLEATFGPTWTFTRPDLHTALREGLEEKLAGVRLGTTLRGLEVRADGVSVELSDGTSCLVDVVVGADGLHSQVRQLVLGELPLRYSGTTCWRGVSDGVRGIDRAVEVWGGRARLGMVPLRGGKLYSFWVLTAEPRAPELSWPDGFRREFGHLWRANDVLDRLGRPPPLHHDIVELEAPVWGVERVYLLGDAAHAMTPNQGQGGAMAVEDALALTRALAPGVEGTLERYRALRHQRVSQVQLDSRRVGEVSHWTGAAATWVRDLALRSLPASMGRSRLESVLRPGLALVPDAVESRSGPGQDLPAARQPAQQGLVVR